MPIVKSRVRNLIDNQTFANEFSHTALHQQNIFDKAQRVLEKSATELENKIDKPPVEQDIEPMMGQVNAVLDKIERIENNEPRRKGGEIVNVSVDEPLKKRYGAFQHDDKQVGFNVNPGMQVSGTKPMTDTSQNVGLGATAKKRDQIDHKMEYMELKEKK